VTVNKARCSLGHETVYGQGVIPETCEHLELSVAGAHTCGEAIVALLALVPRDPFRPDDMEDPVVLERAPYARPDEGQAMTGRELLAILQWMPDASLDLPVYADGCDCVGEAAGVSFDVASITVMRQGADVTPKSIGLRT
jgi:hypothetical protein